MDGPGISDPPPFEASAVVGMEQTAGVLEKLSRRMAEAVERQLQQSKNTDVCGSVQSFCLF